MRYVTYGLLFSSLCFGFLTGFGFGYTQGLSDGQKELFTLTDMPEGGMFWSPSTHAVWSKLPRQTLQFLRIPDPHVAQVMRDFNPSQLAPTQTTIATTTTSTTHGAQTTSTTVRRWKH